MCKKFIISICFILAMLVIAVPASAYEGIIGQQGMTYYDHILLKVDIDDPDTSDTQTNWDAWTMPAHWGPFGPINKVFTTSIGNITVQLNGHKDGAGGNLGGARTRVVGPDLTNDFGKVHQDLTYVAHGSSGLGMDYLQFDFLCGVANAGRTLEFTFWGYDDAFSHAGEPPDSKWAAWSTTEPRSWLTANGYPDGYQPGGTPPDSNMPAGLKALTLGRALQMGNNTWISEFDNRYGMSYSSTFEVTLNELGRATIYGWADMTNWTGSQHVAVNGFAISIPEPTTVALLALGGLALLRKRRT